VSEIEEEAAAERGDRPVLGVEKILSEDTCQRPRLDHQLCLSSAGRRRARDEIELDAARGVDVRELRMAPGHAASPEGVVSSSRKW